MAIDTIKSTAVLDGAIATADIADDAVTADKIATLTGDVSHGDSVKSKFGASDDLQVYHDGSNSYVRDSGTGNLRLTTESSVVLAKHNNENMLKADVDGAVTLYHDAGAKLATTATGVSVTGDLTIAGSGTGVYLGGTGSANHLDDYEEGTWTPTLLGASSNPTVGYALQTGHYTKIGNTVNLYCRLQTNSRSGGSGTALIGGLPFAHNSARAGGGVGYISGVNLSSGYAQFGLSGDAVSSTIRYVQSGDNVGSNVINVTEVASSSNHDIVFTYTYQTNS